MPKINTRKTFIDLKNKLVKEENKEPLTLGMVLANIILMPHKDKKGFRPLKAWELGKKFYDQEEVEVDLSDFVQLKELVENNELYHTIITAQALEMLEKINA